MTSTGLPFEIEVKVIFRDIDALGHVNNAVFLTYVESARIQFFTEVFDRQDVRQLPVILAELTCRYHMPARYDDLLHVGLGIQRIGNRSFEFVFAINGAEGALVASGTTAMVMFDYSLGQAVALPDAWRARLTDYLVAPA